MRIVDYTEAGIPADWPQGAEQASALQHSLRHKVLLTNGFGRLRTFAGIDVSYDIKQNISRAVAVLMDADNLQPREAVMARMPAPFPYVPGLLSFREIPAILKALELLTEKPDMLMVDGQGVAHPRRLGIAAHLGVITDLPAIGVAKSRLSGRYAEPWPKKGSMSPLMIRNEQIGTVLRSKDNVKPLFISPGHRVDQETAVEIVLRCLTKYRLPEPTRIADKLSKSAEAKGEEKQVELVF